MFGDTCSEYCHCSRANTQYCDNIKGECVCNPGWKGNECSDDVNECLGTNNVLCPPNSDCQNTVGSYECICHPGFVKNITSQSCDPFNGCYRKKCSYGCYITEDGKEQCTCPDSLELDVSGLICIVPYYPFGDEAKDGTLNSKNNWKKVNKESTLTSSAIQFSSELPFDNSKRPCTQAYITSNGLIALDQKSLGVPTTPDLKIAQLNNLALIAPYWSDTNPSTGHVNYHLYEKCGPSVFDGIKDETSPFKDKIMTRARNDIIKYHNLPGFEVDSVLVATWVKVQHLSAPKENTFQAIIISGWKKSLINGQEILAEEETSYVIFLYQQGLMNWPHKSGRPISVGFTGYIVPETDKKDTDFVSKLDRVKGNTGYNGVFSYQIGTSDSSRSKCHRYTCNKAALLTDPVFEFEKRTLFECPSTLGRMGAQWQLLETHEDIKCYAIRRLAKSRLLQGNRRNKMCCYKMKKPENPYDWKDVERTRRGDSYEPKTGHVLISDPWPWVYYNNYEFLENIEARATCCLNSDKKSCDKFYKIFPDMGCSNFAAYFPAVVFGDPHIITLDGVSYTMNGWGQYILMWIQTENFTLQARTQRTENSNGTLTNATVFTAFAAQEGDNAKIQVQLSSNNKSMIIYVNGMDVTSEFYEEPTFYKELEFLSVTREESANRTYVTTTFPCGVTIKVYVAVKSLELELEVDKNLQNKTLGLLGNFNDDKSDDFILPDGTVLPSNMSEREIFFSFGQKWEVTASNSIFMYGRNENFTIYQHSDFTPLFGDDLTSKDFKAGEMVCGANNTECILDYIVTGNKEFALNSKESNLKMESLVTYLENNPPVISIEDNNFNTLGQWVVTEGLEATLEISILDVDGDAVFIELIENSTGAIIQDKSLKYLPHSSTPFKLGLRGKDSKGAYSSIVYVAIAVCTGCSRHGICTNESEAIEYRDGYYQVLACSCFPAYTGADCETELDACASRPCSVGQKCTDLTAAEQGNKTDGYVCGPCPSGFTDYMGKCVDIDECSSNNNTCQHNCTNTEGSYTCSCREGFRPDVDNSKACTDINECEEQTAQCTHRCSNTDGGYNCSCFEGYILNSNGFSCDLVAGGSCSQCQQTCIFNTTNNAATCFCNKGYYPDPKNTAECLDVDECNIPNRPCSQGCNNTVGNFQCYCYVGYSLQSDLVSCKVCEFPYYGENCKKTCDCNGHGTCNTVKGCVCDDNWTGVNCDIDVDECDKPRACAEGRVCRNNIGSFSCDCPDGYVLEGTICKDIDECSSLQINGTCNLQTETCINSIGGYSCECKQGYARYESSCQDIDECRLKIDKCAHLCHNFDGGYSCDCEAGYILDEKRQNCTKVKDLCETSKLNCSFGCSLDGLNNPVCICPRGYITSIQNEKESCIDIDECATSENNSCSFKPGCQNTDGSYTCSCPSGAKLDNDDRHCLECTGNTWGVDCAKECACGIGAEKCDPVSGCVCKPGFTGEFCNIQINQCITGNVTCKMREICVPRSGYVTCICQPGYQHDVNYNCVDINECSGINKCTQLCTNTEGSYSCSCYAGFTYNSTSNTCTDMNECKLGTHQCDGTCINTEGSYRCRCPTGLYLQQDGVSCSADKPCADTSVCSEKCANIHGSDTCFCKKGKILAKDNITCDDLDLCEFSPCTDGCIETKGNTSLKCLCNSGRYLAADGITCTDCVDGKFGVNCSKSCSCEMSNTKLCGKVDGTCSCKSGWKGENCTEDVNECADKSGSCKENAYCLNTIGSFYCVCNNGFIEKDNICAECDSNHYGQACASQCSCGEHFKCSPINGTCSCQPGWKGDNCSIDVDECDEELHNCNSTTHQVCENNAGGYQCACNNGYTKSCSTCECKEIPGTHTISTTITLDYNPSALDLTDKKSNVYKKLTESVQKGLFETLKGLESSIMSVTIFNLRQGSLIFESYITISTNNNTDQYIEIKLATVFVEIMRSGVTITIDKLAVLMLRSTLRGTEILPTDTPCDIRNKINPCSPPDFCEVQGEETVCRSKVDEGDSTKKLTLGLSIGIPLFVITVGVLVSICYCKKQKTDKKKLGKVRHKTFSNTD